MEERGIKTEMDNSSAIKQSGRMDGVTFDVPVSNDTITNNGSESLKKGRRSSKSTPHTSPTLNPKKRTTSMSEPPPVSLNDVVTVPQLPEPLLLPSENEYTLFPVQHDDIMLMTKKALSVIWMAEEVELSKDKPYWDKLSDNERKFISNVLGFFAGSDGIVMENLAVRFMREVQCAEAKYFYSCQILMEAVHSETYSLLIDTYITDREEKLSMLRAIKTIPCVAKKAEWAKRWIDNAEASFATRLIGFACVEGIFFSGAFCAIFWLKERGIMPGLTLSNEFIARDEGLHTDFACLLYKKLVNKLTKKEVTKIIREAVKIEKQFITKSLPCELIGMNAKLMCQYIEYVADRLLLQLGYAKTYNSMNPFPFMERISLENKDNFFEKKVSNYAKAHSGKDKSEMVFSTNATF
jgi:ribonucleoside-diphosphate reductase beta chain